MEILPVLFILVAALVTLIFTKVPPETVGLGVIALLILTGSATATQALAGFSHPATLLVASVFIISGGVQRTGVVDGVAVWMRRKAARSEGLFRRIQTLVVAPSSAFVSNTAVVAVFLPVVLQFARDKGFSSSRLLMPLSYASLLGGMCTLVGTSTNIVVANIGEDHGLSTFGMFEFLPLGLAIALPGALYLVLLAPKLIPDRRHGAELTADYPMRKFLTEVEIEHGSPLSGITLENSGLSREFDVEVLEVHRGRIKTEPTLGMQLLEGDVLLVSAPLDAIQRIRQQKGVQLRSEGKLELTDLLGHGMRLAEAVVPPGSPLANNTLQQASFRNKYGCTAIALYHRREYVREKVGKVPLRVGDILLLYGTHARLKELAASPEILSVVQVHPPRPKRGKRLLSVGILAAAVTAASVGLVSLMNAFVGAATLMVVTRCLTVREAFRSVDRRTIFLLAGMISLGLAMERTGVAQTFAHEIVVAAGSMGPRALLSATYIATALLTEILTNNACAVVMTPVAIAAAAELGLDPRPFVMAVAYGASASFLTPIGYQTNMFVYGAGGFRYGDFMRAGWPLSLIAWAAVTFILPMLMPLTK